MTRIVLNSGRYFVSGPAGTGKSTLLRALCEVVREHGVYEPIRLAPSGVAAANISGQTIHSFFGSRVDPTLRQAGLHPRFVQTGLDHKDASVARPETLS
ncbi:hypothetical protein BX616_005982, partial [Lobosporangium transversale]